ncbi:DUF420 domain-containing protein [Vicingaceae bacterium]|nr:DUF420 domain-containing protein [Vicingaceae bacterium]
MSQDFVHALPHLNASLNFIAAMLLLIGYVLIRCKKEIPHRNVMISAFGVSVFFLIFYLIYHANVGSKQFPKEGYAAAIRYFYLAILLTHGVLAAVVPFMAVTTIWLGLTGRRVKHKKLARITFPIWLYVSVTGILVYLMLYWWFPPII